MIDICDIQIRDPFVFVMKDRLLYYLFGTTDTNPWNSHGTGFQAYVGADLRTWDGPFTVFNPPEGFWGTHDFWAPEVYHYHRSFYMLATFTALNHVRATHMLVSDDILGPYVPLTKEPITPSGWQCLDGTLYIDETQHPWIVFCREWVQVHDGEIHAMPLSDDLTRAVGNPVLLFKASSASWTRTLVRRDGSGIEDARVTDGPFLHRQTDGRLVMLWSSLGKRGYAMTCAISDSGRITGPWRQAKKPLIDTDGGHGMTFRAFDNRVFVTYHSPNKTPFERLAYREVVETPNGLELSAFCGDAHGND
ncbi:MAG: glycoside hydrolase family 43 protein [Sphaerochaetaceae bacterium]